MGTLITVLIIVVPFWALFYVVTEALVYRRGGDVFDWAKTVSKYLPKSWR